MFLQVLDRSLEQHYLYFFVFKPRSNNRNGLVKLNRLQHFLSNIRSQSDCRILLTVIAPEETYFDSNISRYWMGGVRFAQRYQHTWMKYPGLPLEFLKLIQNESVAYLNGVSSTFLVLLPVLVSVNQTAELFQKLRWMFSLFLWRQPSVKIRNYDKYFNLPMHAQFYD